MKRSNILITAGIILGMVVFSRDSIAQNNKKQEQQQPKLKMVPVDDRLTVAYGGGGNSGVLVTNDAVVVIDTKMPDYGEELYNFVKQKAGNKKIIVINTHYHIDHTGGNHFYKGDAIYIGDYNKEFLEKNVKPDDMPTKFVKDSTFLNLGDETVEMFNLGQGHTYEDMVVYLKNRKILFSGDLIFNKVNPVLKRESGANVDKWITDLNVILHKWNEKTIIPGHGEASGKEIAQNLVNYFKDMETAAANPGKENEIIAKYSSWMVFPKMCSPEITVQYIRESK